METEKIQKTVVLVRIISIVFVLLLSINGCAHVPPQITSPPAEQIKIDFGKICVVSARFQPETNFKKPKGKIASAAAGAGIGALVVGEVVGVGLVALSPLSIVLIAYPPVAAGIGSAVGGAALIGGVVGAVTAESSKKIKETEKTLNDLIVELRIQEAMREEFVSVFRRHTRDSFYFIQGKGPNAPDEEISYAFLAKEGIDTVLELSVLRVGLWGESGLNPPLTFFMTVRAKVIRVKDSSIIYSHTFRYEGTDQEFTHWASDNGQSFREELKQCYLTLANDIVGKLFLGISPRNQERGNSRQENRSEWDKILFPEETRGIRYEKIFP
jgi:hypothetical protein